MQLTQNELFTNRLPLIKENILATLAYFDLFDYPLTSLEITLFLGRKSTATDVKRALAYLTAEGLVFCFGNFYTLNNDYQLIVRRNKGNTKAAELIKIAVKVSDLLIRFPYVRGIAVSGSLSKNYADEYSDIDLFIITAKNRLWIARTLMHAFKKLTFMVNKQDYFCMNYYIDEAQLEIAEKNIYTATEVVTLIPMQGDTMFEQFYAANEWTKHYLSNKIMRLSSAKTLKNPWPKQLIEALFNNRSGNLLDDILMKITGSRWHKKTANNQTNHKGIIMAMDTGKHYAKPSVNGFHEKLLKRYSERIKKLFSSTQTV